MINLPLCFQKEALCIRGFGLIDLFLPPHDFSAGDTFILGNRVRHRAQCFRKQSQLFWKIDTAFAFNKIQERSELESTGVRFPRDFI